MIHSTALPTIPPVQQITPAAETSGHVCHCISCTVQCKTLRLAPTIFTLSLWVFLNRVLALVKTICQFNTSTGTVHIAADDQYHEAHSGIKLSHFT